MNQSRIPMVDPDSLEPRFGSLHIARTIGQNPELLKAWGGFATYILGPELSITPRERELAILRVGWNHQAAYEWSHHVAIAQGLGMAGEDILAVQEGPDSAHWSELDSLILQAADDLWGQREISAGTWAGLKQFYSDRQMLDLVFILGQYTMVSMVLNSLKVPLEEGFEGF
jgi:alkylhydroperoxidase family enzyme